MRTKKRGPPSIPNRFITHVRPSIALSQNFLRDGDLAAKLIERSSIGRDDIVLEIGAGKGRVTEQLARYAGRVIAVEKDRNFAALLQQKFADTGNVRVIDGDFITMDLPSSAYKVFANVPYNATAAIVSKLTQVPNPPSDAHLVVQEEAAHKFMGVPMETMCALMLKPWFKLNITYRFDRVDFVPSPNVDSVLLRIQQRPTPLLAPSAQHAYRDFVAHCFTHGSPSLYQLLEHLVGRESLRAAASMLRIDRAITPTTLDFELWLCLFCQFWQHATPDARRRVAGSNLRLKREQARLHKWHRTHS